MYVNRVVVFSLISLTVLLIVRTADLGARDVAAPGPARQLPDIQNVLVTDGSTVHNVGELRMHVGNWGLFGSMPGSAAPFAHAPSAEWPAGSGVEYLYAAGLWIGALKDGMPKVSEAAFQFEMRPTADPVDIMYRSSEGALGGARAPDPAADDDGDGAVDEDWLNGRDDDGDGLVDEDYAAISDQMLACWYTDNQPEAIAQYPEHSPMDIRVRQETYQWRDDRYDDFVAVDFSITNIGISELEDVYIAMFADLDAGPRGTEQLWDDDLVGFIQVPASCGGSATDGLEIAYVYDADGDEGRTTGYFGWFVLDFDTDPAGQTAPPEVRISGLAHFAGADPYEQGGDPTNDFERYELLSQKIIERDAVIPRDYRTLMTVGPFASLEPGESLMLRIVWVAGQGLQGMIDNASAAKCLYKANWYTDGPPLLAALDILPGKCPSELFVKTKGADAKNDDSMAGGVLHAALLGRAGFDVADVDVSSIRLEGAAPVMKPEYRDVSSEPMRERACACPGEPDGLMDLVLKFRERDVVEALMPATDGEEKIAMIRGQMKDGRGFYAADCVVMRVNGSNGKPQKAAAAKEAGIGSVLPNPFNPATRIGYYIPNDANVSVAIYDVSGRLIERLVNERQTAGEHTIEWNASKESSGIYFCRFESNGVVETRKLILLK
jgi:hypothetical protein